MSGTKGLILGLLIGTVIGLVGILVTMHVVSGQVDTRERDAFDRGLKTGLDMATDDSIGIDIGGKVNTGLLDENKVLAGQLDDTRNALQALMARDDLTPQAKDQIELILEGMK